MRKITAVKWILLEKCDDFNNKHDDELSVERKKDVEIDVEEKIGPSKYAQTWKSFCLTHSHSRARTHTHVLIMPSALATL